MAQSPPLVGLIDLHTHVLPGLDDGAATLVDSLEIARAAVADGVTALAATPHVRTDYPTTPDALEARLAEVRAGVEAEGLSLEVLPGGEIAIDQLDAIDEDALPRFGLGGNPGVLLLEAPYMSFPFGFAFLVGTLRARGFRTVIAHPERCAEVRHDPERLRPFVEAGALAQLTAASLASTSRETRTVVAALLDGGLAHLAASDTHGAGIRRAPLGQALRELDDEPLALWLGRDVPRAIVDGGELPPRPTARRGRRRRWGPFRR